MSTYTRASNDLAALQHQMADLCEIHPPEEWDVPLLRAVVALLEMRLEGSQVSHLTHLPVKLHVVRNERIETSK